MSSSSKANAGGAVTFLSAPSGFTNSSSKGWHSLLQQADGPGDNKGNNSGQRGGDAEQMEQRRQQIMDMSAVRGKVASGGNTSADPVEQFQPDEDTHAAGDDDASFLNPVEVAEQEGRAALEDLAKELEETTRKLTKKADKVERMQRGEKKLLEELEDLDTLVSGLEDDIRAADEASGRRFFILANSDQAAARVVERRRRNEEARRRAVEQGLALVEGENDGTISANSSTQGWLTIRLLRLWFKIRGFVVFLDPLMSDEVKARNHLGDGGLFMSQLREQSLALILSSMPWVLVLTLSLIAGQVTSRTTSSLNLVDFTLPSNFSSDYAWLFCIALVSSLGMQIYYAQRKCIAAAREFKYALLFDDEANAQTFSKAILSGWNFGITVPLEIAQQQFSLAMQYRSLKDNWTEKATSMNTAQKLRVAGIHFGMYIFAVALFYGGEFLLSILLSSDEASHFYFQAMWLSLLLQFCNALASVLPVVLSKWCSPGICQLLRLTLSFSATVGCATGVALSMYATFTGVTWFPAITMAGGGCDHCADTLASFLLASYLFWAVCAIILQTLPSILLSIFSQSRGNTAERMQFPLTRIMGQNIPAVVFGLCLAPLFPLGTWIVWFVDVIRSRIDGHLNTAVFSAPNGLPSPFLISLLAKMGIAFGTACAGTISIGMFFGLGFTTSICQTKLANCQTSPILAANSLQTDIRTTMNSSTIGLLLDTIVSSPLVAWGFCFVVAILAFLQYRFRNIWQNEAEAAILQGLLHVEALERQIKKQRNIMDVSKR